MDDFSVLNLLDENYKDEKMKEKVAIQLYLLTMKKVLKKTYY